MKIGSIMAMLVTALMVSMITVLVYVRYNNGCGMAVVRAHQKMPTELAEKCKSAEAKPLRTNLTSKNKNNNALAITSLGHKSEDTVQMPDSVIAGIMECLQKADAELQKADIEPNASKAVQNIDNAWLGIFEAMQSAGRTGRMTKEIVEFANKIERTANELMQQIANKALKDAMCALENAQAEEQDAAKLLHAVQAVENAEVAGNAGMSERIEHCVYEAPKIMRKSILMIAELIVKNTKSQNNNEMKKFSAAMEALGKVIKSFSLRQSHCQLSQYIDALMQCASKVRQSVGRMSQAATIMEMPLLRIIDGMRKAIYVMVLDIGVDAILSNDYMAELAMEFGKAMDAAESEFQNAVCAENKAKKEIDGMANLNAAVNSSVRTAKESIDRMKKSISGMKKSCETASNAFSKMMEFVARNKHDRAARKLILGKLGHTIDNDAYVMQRGIVKLRRNVKMMVEEIYILEQNVIILEEGVAKIKQKSAMGNKVANPGDKPPIQIFSSFAPFIKF